MIVDQVMLLQSTMMGGLIVSPVRHVDRLSQTIGQKGIARY
jgi:hypothetical protein